MNCQKSMLAWYFLYVRALYKSCAGVQNNVFFFARFNELASSGAAECGMFSGGVASRQCNEAKIIIILL